MSKTSISDTFKNLSDPQRHGIMGMLCVERMSAGKIAEKLNIALAALSYNGTSFKDG